MLSGQGTYETEGRTFVLQSGEAFLARPDVPIFYRADEVNPWEYYWVGFSGPAAPLLLAQTPFTAARPVLRPAAGDHLRQGLLDIYKARGSDYPAAVRMAGYLQAALGLLMAEGPCRGEEALSRYARQGADFLQRNYSRNVGVEETARTCGVSRSCLYRAFQAEFRCSPSDYLTRFRIQRACQLLCHSTLSVSAVAVSAGFADPFYFSRAFRREVGCSPSAYRTQKTGGAESPDNKEDPV